MLLGRWAIFERIPEAGLIRNGISYTVLEMKGAIPYPERGRVHILCAYLRLGKLLVWSCFNERMPYGISVDYRLGMDVWWGGKQLCSF